METWEYKAVKFEPKNWFIAGKLDTGKYEVEISIYGDQGWEMVNCFDVGQFEGGPKYVVATFKRRKKHAAEGNG